LEWLDLFVIPLTDIIDMTDLVVTVTFSHRQHRHFDTYIFKGFSWFIGLEVRSRGNFEFAIFCYCRSQLRVKKCGNKLIWRAISKILFLVDFFVGQSNDFGFHIRFQRIIIDVCH
jgi:hypothetical protein